MVPLSETTRIDRELEEAQRDLHATLVQVNHKVESVEARLRPEAIMRRNPIALSLVAGAFGFFVGASDESRLLRWAITGVLLGAAVAVSFQGSDNGSKPTTE
jgi:hypothetical protein